jgi:hypothetical protein
MSLRLRLRRVAALPAGAAGRARHRLPGERLQRLSAPDARPHEPAGARLERALGRRRRRGAGRTAGLRRRQPVLPPGRDRQRSLSLHRAPARVGWSTTPCTTAATRAPGCMSRSRQTTRWRAARRC